MIPGLPLDHVVLLVRDLAGQGIEIGPERHFSRKTTDGGLKFSVVRIAPAEPPGVQRLVCQHHTADLLRHLHVMKHANGASRLAFAGAASADHEFDAARGVEIEVIAS